MVLRIANVTQPSGTEKTKNPAILAPTEVYASPVADLIFQRAKAKVGKLGI